MRRAAGAHVVLGVNLEEAARLRPREDRLQVLGLEACPRQSRNRMRRKAGRRGASRSEYAVRTLIMACPRFPVLARLWRVGYKAVRDPCLPSGSTIDVQVPPMTNFHALPWKSTVEVP
jgi:hypothetical protein